MSSSRETAWSSWIPDCRSWRNRRSRSSSATSNATPPRSVPCCALTGTPTTWPVSRSCRSRSTVMCSCPGDARATSKASSRGRSRSSSRRCASCRCTPSNDSRPAALKEFAQVGRSVGFGGPRLMHLDFHPDGFVDDGDPMPSAHGWDVIHAPGHTDDSTCLYHAASATLISGDAVVTHDGAAWFNPEYVDADVAAETEERLRSLDVRHLLPGHGRPVAASDVWRTARSFTEPPLGGGLLARCSRRFASW